jgi:CelD/BcsL family acetyltransferase involved in cellulose biosynthesis
MKHNLWTIQRLSNIHELVSHAPDWERLANNRRMRSLEWVQAWWQAFGSELKPYILVVRKGDEIRGFLPMALETTLVRGRRLILIGNGKACGDDLGLLTESPDAETVAVEVVEFLVQANGQDGWDSLDLDGLQPSNPTSASLIRQLEAVDSLHLEKKPGPSCWTIYADTSWETYLLRLSNRMRKLLKELDRDYLTPGRATLSAARTLDEARQKLTKIAELHQSRWKTVDVDGCFATHGFETFLQSLLERWWKQDIAFVVTLTLDGEEVAGTFGFWENEELAIYLVGMDPKAQKHRPGWMLNGECIKLALQAGKKRINFLRGDEEYKARLGADPTEQHRWVATSPRFWPRIRNSAIRTGVEVRNWLKCRSPQTESAASTVNQE